MYIYLFILICIYIYIFIFFNIYIYNSVEYIYKINPFAICASCQVQRYFHILNLSDTLLHRRSAV